MWFSKNTKVSKKQYEEARNDDGFKVHTKVDWLYVFNHLKQIEYKYNVRDCMERDCIYFSYDHHYPKDDNPDESWLYNRVKTFLMYIGDGWGKGYIRKETIYITDDFVMPDTVKNYEFTELENGDLLVKDSFVTKKTESKTITEVDTTRYDCGTWRKKIVESEYSKQLIDDEDFEIIAIAKKFCKDFETVNNLSEFIKQK